MNNTRFDRLFTRFSFLLLCVFLISSAFSVNAQKNTRALTAFDGLKVSNAIEVNLIPADENKVVIVRNSGDDEDLITEVQADVLIIKLDGINIIRNVSIELEVYHADNLEEVRVSSAASIRSSSTLTGKKLDLTASSAGKIDLDLAYKNIDISINSGASVDLSGAAKSLYVKATSGATLTAEGLEADDVDATANSGASVRILANEKLKAKASSGARVRYAGKARKTNVSSNSGGKISTF